MLSFLRRCSGFSESSSLSPPFLFRADSVLLVVLRPLWRGFELSANSCRCPLNFASSFHRSFLSQMKILVFFVFVLSSSLSFGDLGKGMSLCGSVPTTPFLRNSEVLSSVECYFCHGSFHGSFYDRFWIIHISTLVSLRTASKPISVGMIR